jgi:diguanylate cyclase (GGDEF)-like protein
VSEAGPTTEANEPALQTPDFETPAAPAVARQRVVEVAGTYDLTTRVVAVLVMAILLATAIFRDAWALLPLAVLATCMAIAPLAIRRARPQRVELAFSLVVTIAMAIAAGLVGGTSGPLVFLLPVGVVMNARRAGPRPVAFCSLVTAAFFVGASLVADPGAVWGEPLPMLAVLAMQLGVTIGVIALAEAEIGHRRASIVDPLTGLLNRQGLRTRFEEVRRQARVGDAPVTLILCDLDHFKRVNDSRGHHVGDRILCEVADRLRHTLRTFDLVYRIGGEEFLVLLPDVSEREGGRLAEQMRRAIERLGEASGTGVTASFGVSAATGVEVDFDRLYRRADQALYRAKRAGRDRVDFGGAELVGQPPR